MIIKLLHQNSGGGDEEPTNPVVDTVFPMNDQQKRLDMTDDRQSSTLDGKGNDIMKVPAAEPEGKIADKEAHKFTSNRFGALEEDTGGLDMRSEYAHDEEINKEEGHNSDSALERGKRNTRLKRTIPPSDRITRSGAR